jgi:hypothetical protein
MFFPERDLSRKSVTKDSANVSRALSHAKQLRILIMLDKFKRDSVTERDNVTFRHAVFSLA